MTSAWPQELVARETGPGAVATRMRNGAPWAIAVFLGLAPIWLGSNRPVFWAANALVLGVFVAIWSTRVAAATAVPSRSPLLRACAVACCVYLSYLVVQILPLTGLFGLFDPTLRDASAISLAPGATQLMLVRNASYVALFLLAHNVGVNDSHRNLLLRAVGTVIAAHAVFGLVALHTGDTILGLDKWAYQNVATGTFVNRNSFATFLAFGAVILAAQCIAVATERNTTAREVIPQLAIYGLGLCFILATVAATESRMGLAVTAIGVVSVCLLGMLRVRRPSWLHAVAVLVIIAATVVTISAYGDGLLDRLASVDDASETRTTLYWQVLALISQRPWTGFGGGSFEIVFPLVHAAPVSPDLVWDKAHNTYLALWVEMGVVFGSLPPAILLVTALYLLRSLFRRIGSWRSQATAVGAIAVAGAHSLVDFSLEIEANAFVLATLVALGLAGSTLSRRRS